MTKPKRIRHTLKRKGDLVRPRYVEVMQRDQSAVESGQSRAHENLGEGASWRRPYKRCL